MRRLDIDFQRVSGRSPSAGMVLLVLALLVGGALLLAQQNLSDQLAAMDEMRVQADAGADTSIKQDSESDRVLQQAFDQMALPWAEVFASVEEAAGSQVLLLGLEGDGSNGVIRIFASATGVETMLAYLEQMKTTGKLNAWRLLSHRKEEDGTLHFVIQAELPEGK